MTTFVKPQDNARGAETADAGKQEERRRLHDEIAAAMEIAGQGSTSLFVLFDRAASYFGDELLSEVSPRNLVRQLRFRISAIGSQRVCDYFLAGGIVQEGDLIEVSKNSVFQEVAEVIAGGDRAEVQRSRARFYRRMAKGDPVMRNAIPIDSTEKIDAYIAHVEELIESIRRRGVVRRDLDISQIAQLKTSVVRPLAGEIMEQDVGVGLMAGGELIRVCAGAHRTAAARLLGLATIPVELRLIHVEFLAKVMAQRDCDAIEAVRHCVRHVEAKYRFPQSDP